MLTQGDPVYPTIFIIVMDEVVREVMLEVFRHQEVHHGFEWDTDTKIVFYVYNGRILGCNPIWVQTTLTAMVRIFKMLVLLKNIGKTKSMVCTPGFI